MRKAINRVILIGKLYKYAGMPEPGTDDFYTSGWNVVIARYLQRFPGKDFTIESWRVDDRVTTEQQREIAGVTYRVFPKLQFRGKYLSDFLVLLVELIRQKKSRHTTLIHYQQLHSFTLYALLILTRGYRFVVHQHGDINPQLSCLKHHKFRYKVYYLLERLFFRRISKIFYLRADEHDYLRQIVPEEVLEFLPVGVDFDQFTPQPPKTSRAKTGIPEQSLVFLFIGLLDGRRNFALVIDAFRQIHAAYPHALLVCVGMQNRNNYENELHGLPVMLVPWVDRNEMPLYYSAADYLLSPGFSELNFMGFDLSISESLACGTPVISNQITELGCEIANELGIPLYSKTDIAEDILQRLSEPARAWQCRRAAIQHLSLHGFCSKLVSAYKHV